MSEPEDLKILFVEDTDADFELSVLELERNDLVFAHFRVETEIDFKKSLGEFKPDLVISDYSLPQFNGKEALKISKSYDSTLPFIILTGTMNEEIAVECMKAGATDYVIKEHIGKLSFAVREALRYREAMLERTKVEKALHESESRYRSMFENNYAVMLLIDPEDGVIVDVNPAASEYYGFNREEFIGKHIYDITSGENEIMKERMNIEMTKQKNHFISKHILYHGQERSVEVFCSPISYSGKNLLHCIIQDITDRNKAVEALRSSLNEKKDLIQEIYHRTKNNMQVIISMFALQSMLTGDEKLDRVLKDMESRIRAMSLVHEKLYQSKNMSKLFFKDYLLDLIKNIMSGYGIKEDKIQLIDEMSEIEMLIDTAIPCGLVVNELVSNVVKYAFPGDEKGDLIISLSIGKPGEVELIVADNGSGSGLDLDFVSKESIGLQIVKNIVEYQLKGSVELDNTNGVKWTIKFKDDLYEERV